MIQVHKYKLLNIFKFQLQFAVVPAWNKIFSRSQISKQPLENRQQFWQVAGALRSLLLRSEKTLLVETENPVRLQQNFRLL